MANRILCLNFGSTSTKIAAFSDEEKIFSKSWSAGDGEYPDHFEDLAEHEAFAADLIEKELKKHGLTFEDFDIFSARGGAQVFIESGAYGSTISCWRIPINSEAKRDIRGNWPRGSAENWGKNFLSPRTSLTAPASMNFRMWPG